MKLRAEHRKTSQKVPICSLKMGQKKAPGRALPRPSPKKATKNRTKMNQKSVQNQPQIGPGSVQNRLWSRLRFRCRLWTDFGTILVPSWGHLEIQNRAMLGACESKKRFFEVQQGIAIRSGFSTALKSLLGTILERFGVPKSSQNRSRIDFKRKQAKKTKMSKNY